jgi:hypothetical protein
MLASSGLSVELASCQPGAVWRQDGEEARLVMSWCQPLCTTDRSNLSITIICVKVRCIADIALGSGTDSYLEVRPS